MKPMAAAGTMPSIMAKMLSDGVVMTMTAAFALIALIDHDQAYQSAVFTLRSGAQILPFLLLAILLAAYAKASGADRLIAHAFSGNPAVSIAAASLAGALSPFCSCGVIPLIAAMLASGVPLAPVMAFCIASPIMDPEMFILTAAGISTPFALAKTLAAIGMGLAAGTTVLGLQRLGLLENPLKKAVGCACNQPPFEFATSAKVTWRFWKTPVKVRHFKETFRNSGLFLGKWMMLAFFLESLMLAYMPVDQVAGIVGQDSAIAIPLSALIGIPAYMNGYAAIPLISGLLQVGMAPGAAMALITAGAVSSIPAAAAVYALVRGSVFAVYVAIGLMGSVLAGYVYQLFIVWL